jgi:hypothetical protein
VDEFLQGAEDVVRETITQTKDAVDQAKVIVRDVGRKLKEKYPDGLRAAVEVHFSGEDEAPEGEHIADKAIPSQDLRGLDIRLTSGDVTLRLAESGDSPVVLEGDGDKLEVERTKDGVLTIRQRSTASSSFFLSRGLGSTDVELWLPKRAWDTIQIATSSGDVEIEEGITCKHLTVKTGSGDLSAQGSFETVRCTAVSGDVEITGTVENIRCSSASGDLTVASETAPESVELTSKSGDCRLLLPQEQDFVLQFSTVSGKIVSEFPLTGPVGARSGEARYRDGGERTYHLASVSGDIRLETL